MNTTALLIIDVQNDYFPGGKMALPKADETANNIKALLNRCRTAGLPIIHIQHISLREGSTFFLPDTDGVNIHDKVTPEPGEIIIQKNFPNSFLQTELLEKLRRENITNLLITGMMTFMCVDATTRAAKDLGFTCILPHDCTTTPPTEFNGVACTSEQAKATILSALSLIVDQVIGADDIVLP